MNPKSVLDNSPGFTLVEVLAAVLILAVASTALINMSSHTLLATSNAGKQDEALQLAQNILNDDRNLIESSDVQPVSNPPSPPGYTTAYQIYVQVTPLSAGSVNGYTTPPSEYQGKNHVTVQSIVFGTVYSAIQPYVLTVTVYW
ncbi:MAG TPA: prepilin-type N-terminal cleavage/methylation domain-containing protein [Desulfobacteria bacterium]|nr:prepilin-type N-terminal cleavage/methylation domain-containing protein [Desulfobacteria bacterium]